MSSITWNGDRIMQRIGNDAEELGYVGLDNNSGTYVLWLKDTCGVLGPHGGYIRGDEFASMPEAKDKAPLSPSASIMHYIWMRRAAKRQVIEALDEHWDEISSELDSDIRKETLCARISEHLAQLPIDEIKKWSERIRDGLVVNVLVELIKNLLGG